MSSKKFNNTDIEAYKIVRQSGLTNMFDRVTVQHIMYRHGDHETADKINNLSDYIDLINLIK